MRVKYHCGGCGGVGKVRSGGLWGWGPWVRTTTWVTSGTGVIIGVVVGVVRMMWVVRVMEVAYRCCWPLVTAP